MKFVTIRIRDTKRKTDVRVTNEYGTVFWIDGKYLPSSGYRAMLNNGMVVTRTSDLWDTDTKELKEIHGRLVEKLVEATANDDTGEMLLTSQRLQEIAEVLDSRK